jgi:hypothetical protein
VCKYVCVRVCVSVHACVCACEGARVCGCLRVWVGVFFVYVCRKHAAAAASITARLSSPLWHTNAQMNNRYRM